MPPFTLTPGKHKRLSTPRRKNAFLLSPEGADFLRRHAALNPELVQAVSANLSDRLTLAGSAAVDCILDQALSGTLKKEPALGLAKMAQLLLHSAGIVTDQHGGKDTMSKFLSELGVQSSHAVSRLTLEKITVESSKTLPPVEINPPA